jgi:PAS domain S-box-containing protein
MLYQRLFKTCAAENLPLWQCPNFIFFVMGLVTIGVMMATYFISRVYLSIELVTMVVIGTTIVLLILSYSVSSGVQRLGKAKRQAEFEKAKTQAIINHLSDGLIMLDSHCRVALVNPRAEHYLGIKEREVLGYDVREKFDNPDWTSFFKVAHWCPLSSREIKNKVFKEEFVLLKPRKIYIKTQTSTVQNEQGETIGFIKVLHDITRDRELDEIKSDFISIASHQLKTPLSTIKWNLEIIDKPNIGKLTDPQKDLLEKTKEANEEMINVVRDLLDVSKIEQGRSHPQLSTNSLPTIIRDVITHYQQYAEKKNIKLNTDLPNHDIKFLFDASAIKIALTNLVDNAVKYTPGHGRVSVSLAFEPTGNPTHAVVNVSDTGVGIPKEEQKHLFTKFFRSKNISRLNTKGTGLGLYIAKNIIDLHHGRISCESTQDRGTTFSISLPLKFSAEN